MGQTVMDENASGKRKHLRLVLQPSEWAGEYHPVVIPLEIGAGIGSRQMKVFQSESLVGYQLSPFHTQI